MSESDRANTKSGRIRVRKTTSARRGGWLTGEPEQRQVAV